MWFLCLNSQITHANMLQANFYLAFFFIAGSLSDEKIDPFGHNVGKYIFIVLRYACILVMCLQFIISMGNRPQGYVFLSIRKTTTD